MGKSALCLAGLAALGLSCLVGCFSPPTRPPDPIHLSGDSEAVRREVVTHVPYGMPLKQARATLEANGFTCDNDRRSRVMVCDARPNEQHTSPVRLWLFYDPQETVKEIQARCE